MSIFKFLHKPYTEVLSCVEGTTVALKEVRDEVFSIGAIGRGIAIRPTSSQIIAPIDGVITMIFPTNHAIGIITSDGLEFLIHIGIDTVKLKGEGFKRVAHEGQEVKKGDLLMVVDFELLKSKKYDTDTLIILTTVESKACIVDVIKGNKKVNGGQERLFTCYAQ